MALGRRHDRRQRGILAALAHNRGELDAAALERLLRRAAIELPPVRGTGRPREPYRRAA